jgi:hypothetical protein
MSLHETENRVRYLRKSIFLFLLRMHIDGKIHQGFQIVRLEFEKLDKRKNEIDIMLENEKERSRSRSREREQLMI